MSTDNQEPTICNKNARRFCLQAVAMVEDYVNSFTQLLGTNMLLSAYSKPLLHLVM
jgi:hypothetical protein